MKQKIKKINLTIATSILFFVILCPTVNSDDTEEYYKGLERIEQYQQEIQVPSTGTNRNEEYYRSLETIKQKQEEDAKQKEKARKAQLRELKKEAIINSNPITKSLNYLLKTFYAEKVPGVSIDYNFLINLSVTTLILTIIFEIPVFILLIKGFTRKRILLYSILINCLTQPIAFYSYWHLLNSYIIMEIAVIAVELILIKLLFETNWRKTFLISFLANLTSVIFGGILIHILS